MFVRDVGVLFGEKREIYGKMEEFQQPDDVLGDFLLFLFILLFCVSKYEHGHRRRAIQTLEGGQPAIFLF